VPYLFLLLWQLRALDLSRFFLIKHKR